MKQQLIAVVVLTACSQLAAFFKLWFTAGVFGVGSELDGYNLALVAPTFLSGVLSGVLQVGFFPVRARLHAAGDAAATMAFERAVFWCCGLIGVLVALAIALGSPLLAHYFVPDNQLAVRDSFLFVLPLVAFLIPLNMAGDSAGYMLAMRDRFGYAAGAPIVNGIIGGLLLFAFPELGMVSMVLGTLIGLLAQFLICIYGLHLSAFSFFGRLPTRSSFLESGKSMLTLGGWILPGIFFSNIVASIPPVWAASYGEGVVSAFGYAYRLHMSVVQLLIMSSSTLILARFSTLVSQNDQAGIKILVKQATLMSIVLGVICPLCVLFLGEPVLALLFSGRFDAAAAHQVTRLWFWLTIGIGLIILSNVFGKLWQAQARPKLMSMMSAFSLLGVYGSYFIFRQFLDERSVALALLGSPAAVIFVGFWLLNPLKRAKSERTS